MNQENAEKYNSVTLNSETLEMISDVIKQDEMNIRILFYIVSCHKSDTAITVKSICENVKVSRRSAVKNSKNEIVSFGKVEDFIDRKTAERIIERLASASLIYFEVQLPYKFIKLTQRGMQVALNIRKRRQTEGND